MVFVDDLRQPRSLTESDAPPPARRLPPAPRRAGGGRRRRRLVGRRAGWSAGAGRGRPITPAVAPPRSRSTVPSRASPTSTERHGGLRPGQGRPSRVGGPEAHRAGGGPHRPRADRPHRWCGGRGTGPSGPSSASAGWPARRRPSAAGRGCPRWAARSTSAGSHPGSGRWPCARPRRGAALPRPIRCVAVGPEGGWDEAELAASQRRSGWVPPCSGPRRRPWPPAPSCAVCGPGLVGPLRNHAP